MKADIKPDTKIPNVLHRNNPILPTSSPIAELIKEPIIIPAKTAPPSKPSYNSLSPQASYNTTTRRDNSDISIP